MKSIKRNPVKVYVALAVAGLVMLYLWPTLVTANPLTSQQHLERAWKLASDIGVYKHRSEVVQTSHPTPRLENSGRSPKVEQLMTSGFMNLPQNEMHLTLEGRGSNQPAIEIKVENGKTYGRPLNSDEWTELEDSANIFGSGGDPLGFLTAVENVQEVSSDPEQTPYSHFTFDLNGPRYAGYMANQLKAELQRRGELPPGMSLGLADQYLNMKAYGEIWLNDEGLPVRQVLHLEFPPERNAYEWYEADITTTFQGWETGAVEHQLFWAIPRLIENPSLLVDDPLSLLPDPQVLDSETMQMMGIMLGLSLLLAALAVFVFTHRHSQKMYAAFSLAVIVSMLITPLLQSNHVLAFSQNQHARQAGHEQQQESQRAAETLQVEMTETDFDPRVDPLAEVGPPPNPLPEGEGTIASPPLGGIEGGLSLPQLQTTSDCTDPIPGDSDCDGNPDDDGDGLTDQIEVVKLGTDPNDIDTDGDRISDKVEVEGFSFNGQQWYLDPLNPDSNYDGVQDFLECSNLVDITAEGIWPATQLGTTCENTDGDTTPDVFDFDNDGDGVPDTLDLALNYVGGVTSNTQSDLLLDLSNFTTDKTMLVDFQIRPANSDNLWQNNNVFDWPDNDESGQINRVFSNTFADISDSENPAPKLGQGDVMLTPLLQIKIADPASNTANPAGSLPIDASFSGDITTAVLTDWLDIDMMNDYAISVNEDEEDGSLYAYVPLAQVTDPVGDAPVAWQARMAYRPEMADWGQAHEVKLLWTVLALTDSCDISGLSDPDDADARADHCADYDNWVTEQSIIQTYYEDFTLTGLTVTEDHGSKTAVMAQTDALNVSYETHLWQLVRGLQSTFLVGDQISTDTRFDIEEIKNRFDKDTTPYTTGDEELWDIPGDKIIVQDNSAVDATTAFSDLQSSVPALLNSTYGGAVTGDAVTLLFAREDTSRSAVLEDTDLVTINNNAISVDFSDALLSTYASLNWAPYQRGSAKWNAYEVVDYLLNDLEPALEGLSLSDLQTMVADQTITDEDTARDGAIFLAQNYYLTFYQGLADLVEIEGQIVGQDIVNNADFSLGGENPIALIISDMLDLMATLVENDQSVYVSGSLVANSNFEALEIRSFLLESASFGEARLGIIISDAGGILVGRGVEWVTKKVYKKFNNFSKTTPKWGKYGKRVGTGLSILSVGAGIGGEFFFKDEDVKRTMLLTAAGATLGSEVLGSYGAFTKVSLLKQLKGLSPNVIWAKSGARVWDQMLAVKSVVKTGAIVGLAVETVATIGFLAVNLAVDQIQWGSIQANLLVSETIGQIVVALIAAVISLSGIGALIVGLFAIIDALISLICELRNVDPTSKVRQWVCGGFSNAIAQGVSYLIYDYYTPYDVNNKDRLAISYDMGQPINNTGIEGFVAGNSIQIGANISNTITLAKPERVIIKTSYLKPGTLKLDTERLLDIGQTSTFSYTLTTNPPAEDADNNLNLNGTTWQGNTSFFSPTDEFIFTEGVNVLPKIYLSEQYNLATIECWGFVGADEKATCEEDREFKGANNTPIGGLFVFDILPNKVNRLPRFFRTQYRQLDSDGDGLLTTGSGLTDPDDTTWDTDNDGLSDFWEMNTPGFDPEDPDSDNDGLYDYWEAFYQTNPLLPDSDSDGLQDSDEFYHSNARSAYVDDNSTWSGGWTVIYDYSGSQSLQTLVSADPLDSDTDADTILDNLERAYGYHPNLPSIVNVLTLDSRPDALAYLPNSTINYTATVKNELDNRVAYGLLETEFPVDVVKQQQIINALYPQVETGLSGALTAPNTGQSLTQDLVVRAGALIGTTAVDEVFVLPFDETGGSITAFIDATSARHDFTCTACPTANSGFATFDGSQTLTRPHDDDFDASPFSLSAWVRPTARGGVIYDDLNDFTVEQLSDGTIQATIDSTQLTSTAALALDKWNYVVVAYDGSNATIFVNSIESASGSVGAMTRNNGAVEIGSGFTGDMDRIALHTSVLTKEDILDVFNGLTMYVSFDDGEPTTDEQYCGFTDTISQRSFDCDDKAVRDERRFDNAYPIADTDKYAIYYKDTLTIAPQPGIFAGVTGDSVALTQTGSGPDSSELGLDGDDEYLHFNHEVALAGTIPGENDNAFSIALWIHPKNAYETVQPIFVSNTDGSLRLEYGDGIGAILTLPDQPGTDPDLDDSKNPMYYTVGDGAQVRVEGINERDLRVKVGECTATINEFMFKGETDIIDQFFNIYQIKPADYWQHLVIAFNGQDTLNLYQNGELVSSKACFTTTDFKTVDGFTIGYSALTNNRRESPRTFNGYIDDLRFYNRSFTGDDAKALYLNTNVKFDFNGRTGQTFFENDSPSGITGTCSGETCPQSGLSGLDNQVVQFDGSDYIELSDDAEAMGLKDSSFTIMGWVKGSGSLLGVQPDSNNNWLFAGVSGNKAKIYWTGTTGAEAPTSLDSNQWNHLAFRYQERNINDEFLGEIKIYVNGVLEVTDTNNLAFAGNGVPRLGQSQGENFSGLMDNVIVAGYALSKKEILAHLNQAPLLNLHLDEGLENVLQSFTSFSDDGVLGLTATCSGDACPVAGSRGQMREALVFDGDDMLTLPHDAALNEESVGPDGPNLAAFSVGLWVKPQQEKSTQQTLVVKGSDTNEEQNYGLFIKPDSMKVEYSATGFCNTTEEEFVVGESIGSLNQDQWNYVMLTSEFTLNGISLKLYLNGAYQGETFTFSPCKNSYPIRIGDSPAADGLVGSIDEFTFHNVTLTAEEIKALYDYQASWYDTTVHNQIVIDAEAPQVDVGPSPTFMNQQTRLLSLSAYDPDSGLASVSVQITDPQGGVTTQDAKSSIEPNSSAWFYTFTPNQSGLYTIKTTATDGLGYTKTATKYIDVDTATPGTSLTSNSYEAQTDQLTLSGSVFDTNGFPRSGVATETMTVDVQDRSGRSISGPIAATITPNNPNNTNNGVWNVAYPFPTIPYGEFTTLGVVADRVGNTSEGAISNGSFELDEIGPIADVVIATDILGGLTPEIQGTASDIGYNLTGQQTVFHFEDPPGVTKFIDGSPGQVVATCATSDCPTAWQNGKYGRSAAFDGLDDLLELGTTPAISGTQAFAVAAWILTRSDSEQVIIQQRSTAAGDGQYQLSLNPDGTVNWSLDGSDGPGFDIDSTNAVNNNQWRHILALRESDGTGRLYIDGVADGIESSTPRTLLEAPVFIGGDGMALDNFFNGTLDEVTIYTGAPTADEVYYIANPLVSRITDVQVRFRSFAERDIGPDEGTWHSADFSSFVWFTPWSLSLPSLSPGNYKIDLKATDSHGNTRYIGDTWTGGVLDYDLQISAEADVSSVSPGEQITYTATYTNSAGSDSSVPGAELALVVPVDMSFNATLNDPGWSCVPDTSTGSLCAYPVGELTPGESGVMTATLDVLNQISAGAGIVSTTLTIGPLGGEGTPGNNAATIITPITGAEPELAVIKSTAGVTPTTDSRITYTITVTNSGNKGATVVLTETVPAHSQTGVVTGPPWDCENFGGPGETCVLELGVVPAGDVATTTFSLYIDAFVPENAVLTNTIQVAEIGNDGELSPPVSEFTLVSPIDQGPEPNLFGVVYDPVIIEEGEVATNTLTTPCDPEPFDFCELGANPSLGELGLSFGGIANDWRFISSDGPDESATVTINFFSPNGNTSTNFELTVLNVAPTITITGDDVAQVGNLYTATLGEVVDPGDDTVTACTLNWGDGDSDDCLTAIGGGSLDHTYPTSAVSRTITVDLTDEDGLHLLTGAKVISFTENTAPVLAEIAPQTVAETETLTFTAVATDAEGAPLTYGLVSGPSGAIVAADTGLFTWTTDENDGGNDYVATLIVSDGTFSTTTVVEITVTEVNAAPVFAAVSDPTIDEGETLNLSVTASDSDIPEQTLTYSLDVAPTGASINPVNGLFSWTADTEDDGSGPYPVIILVSDGVVTESNTIQITINEINEAPLLDPIAAQTITAGETVTFTATASDSDLPSQNLTYSLENEPAGATIDPDSGLFSWDSDTAGLYIATVIVSDGDLTDSQNVAIIVEPGSVAPQFFPFADQTVLENNMAQYIIAAYDANGDSLTYSLGEAPSGAVISPTTALFTWLTAEEDGPGIYPVTVIASDGTLTDSLTINITVVERNAPPTLGLIADQSVVDGETLTFTAVATDTDVPTQTLTFSLSDEPAGATINSSSGLFNWVAAGVGVYTPTVAVSDGEITTSQTVTITVTAGNDPPVLTTISDQTVDEGDAVSFTATATDSDVPPQTLTYSLSEAPIGATISATTGLFTWPTTEADGPGVYSATVIVSDGTLTDSQTIEITVNEVNEAPVLAGIANQTITQGETVSFTAVATDTDVPAQTLSYSLSDAPAEANIDSDGEFSWITDENDSPGVYSVTISVSDGLLTDSQTINITVNDDNTAPVLTAIGPQIITETQTLTFTAVATDAEGDTLTYGLYNPSSGMSLDPDSGEFSWTPTEAQGPGTYFAGLIVSDTTGLTDTTIAMVTVNELNEAPVLAAIGDQTLAETELFTLTLTATDNDLPVNTLSYTMTNAPAGATLADNLFSWTPDASQGPGEYTLTFIVSDDGSPVLTDSEIITLTVTDSPGVMITESDGSTEVSEDGATDAYEVALKAQPAEDVIITITSDNQLETSATSLTFTSDNWHKAQTVLVSAVDDAVYEGPHTGTVSHTVSSLDSVYAGLSIANIIVNISDNDLLPSLDISNVTIEESIGTASISVTLSGESIFPVSVNYTISDGTASGNGVDYSATDGTLTWAANTSGTQTIAITLVDDTLDEPDETVNISLSNVVSATLVNSSGVLTITDNDAAANLAITKSVAATHPAAVQPGEAITYTIVVANNGSDALGVVVSDTLPAYINGANLNQTVDIAANESVTFTIPATVANNVPAGVTITNTAGFSHTSGSGQAMAAVTSDETVTPAEPVIYISSDSNGSVNGFSFADEDILAYNPNSGSWSKYFDGSDVGLRSTDLDAFYLLDDGSILLSLDRPKSLPGLGWVDDSDIVRFIPSSLGQNTAGSFEWYFDGSDVKLSWGSEDVDTIAFTPEGDLVISTIGPFAVPWIGGRDEDLIVFKATSLGQHTSGAWERYLDGSDVGLRRNSEDVRGAWIDPVNNDVYLTTKGNFSVEGFSGDGADIFICHPESLGANTSCAFSFYWDGSEHGFAGERIDAFTLVPQTEIEAMALTTTERIEADPLPIVTQDDTDQVDNPEEEDIPADDADDGDDSDEVHNLDDISTGADGGDNIIFLPIIIHN